MGKNGAGSGKASGGRARTAGAGNELQRATPQIKSRIDEIKTELSKINSGKLGEFDIVPAYVDESGTIVNLAIKYKTDGGFSYNSGSILLNNTIPGSIRMFTRYDREEWARRKTTKSALRALKILTD